MSEDGEEISLNRREYLLAAVGATGYSSTLGFALESELEPELAVEPEEIDRQFEEFLYSNYPEPQVQKIDKNQENLLFDIHYVEGEEMPEEDIEIIESLLEDTGLNSVLLENEEKLDRTDYQQYGSVAPELLEDRDSLWSEQTDPIMKGNAIQLFFVPGKPEMPNKGQLKTFVDGQELWVDGKTIQGSSPRAVMAFDEPYRVKGTVHEIGHTLGLEHTEREDDIMNYEITSDTCLEFSDEQVRTMNSNL
ncbi:matrixin family metalloprotease [Candidatus Nanohalococcus occultus]|uniref:Peptidase M10 metallopeptidase domain-containing protein n=1 Tax=Candidatus Nanohalococcus occultus TaxID=2978047 RepID=A0ABY8CJ28_9ARCH|nr:hypothetical protein SVXNc_0672 [Candidatus Nanohaloarchaeota archaeon SVXNc]